MESRFDYATQDNWGDGPGHVSVVTDDAGTDWLVYHAIPTACPAPTGARPCSTASPGATAGPS